MHLCAGRCSWPASGTRSSAAAAPGSAPPPSACDRPPQSPLRATPDTALTRAPCRKIGDRRRQAPQPRVEGPTAHAGTHAYVQVQLSRGHQKMQCLKQHVSSRGCGYRELSTAWQLAHHHQGRRCDHLPAQGWAALRHRAARQPGTREQGRRPAAAGCCGCSGAAGRAPWTCCRRSLLSSWPARRLSTAGDATCQHAHPMRRSAETHCRDAISNLQSRPSLQIVRS